jgi:hypothetical protein
VTDRAMWPTTLLPVLALIAGCLWPASVADSRPWPHGDPNVVVRSILAQPAYQQQLKAEPAQESLVARIVRWIGDRLAALFKVVRVPGVVERAAPIVWLALAVIAAALLAYLAFGVVTGLAARRGHVAGTSGQPLEESVGSTALNVAAAVAAERGEYAKAIALLFHAALAALDEHALVAYDAARTPGEYRRVVRRALARAAGSFDDLASRFERASFSAAPASRGDYEAAARAFVAFQPLATTL